MTAQDSVYAKRIIKAPIERVFRAWTDPEELKQWHAPQPNDILAAVSDNRVGGNRSLTLTIEGKTYQMAGTYIEFDPPHRLVYGWTDAAAPNDSITTVLFKAVDDNATEVQVTYTNPVHGPLQVGLRMILDHLEHLVAPK